MAGFEDIFTAARHEIAIRSRAVKLKDYVLDKDPTKSAVQAADRLVIAGKAIDVFGMVLTGIDLFQTVQDAVTLTRTMHLMHEVEMGLRTAENVGNIAKGASIMSTERYLFAANAFGVLATYVGVWLSIAGAWAAAKADILTDNAMTGASRGAVLGANDALPSYVGSQGFWMWAKPFYPAMREAESAARNVHNIALVAGYAQRKILSPNQKGNLFRFLHARMSPGSRSL